MSIRVAPLVSDVAEVVDDINLINQIHEIKPSHAEVIEFLGKAESRHVQKKSDESKMKNEQDLNVEIFFTKDAKLLSEYYKLRDRCFREDSGWYEYDGSETLADAQGKILVATNNRGEVVAGMRFLPPDCVNLSLQEKPELGFTYKEVLKRLNLNPESKFSEISAVAVDKPYRNRILTKRLITILTEESVRYGCDHIVGSGILPACRDYRMVFSGLGYKMSIILNYPWKGRATNKGYQPRYPMIVYLNKSLENFINNFNKL